MDTNKLKFNNQYLLITYTLQLKLLFTEFNNDRYEFIINDNLLDKYDLDIKSTIVLTTTEVRNVLFSLTTEVRNVLFSLTNEFKFVNTVEDLYDNND